MHSSEISKAKMSKTRRFKSEIKEESAIEGENDESGPLPKKRKIAVNNQRKGSAKKTKTGILVKDENDSCSSENETHADSVENDILSDASSSYTITHDPSEVTPKAKRLGHRWKDEDVVAESTNIPVHIAKNVLTLFDQDCTIPFIVRYRRPMTGSLSAEKLRDIQAAYDEVKLVHKKVNHILKTVKSEKFDKTAASALLSAKTLEEVEFLCAPFKSGSKRTLAERAKQLGLEPLALQIMDAKISFSTFNFANYIKQQDGLRKESEILTGIQHIIADIIAKDRRVLDFVRTMSNHEKIRIVSAKSPSAEKNDRRAHVVGKTTENFKYENYFNLNIALAYIAHHQVMAINRGEKQKVLTVKIQIPFEVGNNISAFICNTFFRKDFDSETVKFLKKCSDDSYNRLIEPHLSRHIRSDLTKKAEKESIAVFCSNVRSLLLTPPVRGKTVIGIDPGFSHGCKLAAVSSKGEVLRTDVIYPHSKNNKQVNVDGTKLKNMISSFSVEIIAIGNGTACRETELWLSNLIRAEFFKPFQIKYCIVNESGVSIYSVTKEAENELPDMDPNVRSAVAIARRLQDPLLEYVKIEPKHLGVGMYQHDVPEAQLKKALDSVVEECVSFVGVDLNVCPELLLRKVSGLNAARAKQIVEWRVKNGSFINREQLRTVKGLGPKSFEQCAGFVKILPETSSICEKSCTKKAKSVIHKRNPLDRTIVHPESYAIAEKFLKTLNASPEEVGMQTLVDKVKIFMKSKSTESVAESLNVPVPVMQLIVDAFSQLQDYDIREEFDQPDFTTSVRKFADLKVGQELTGRVRNVAGFGSFVDIGVENSGLIHNSKMNGQTTNVGDKITVKVLSLDFEKKRIQLELIKK